MIAQNPVLKFVGFSIMLVSLMAPKIRAQDDGTDTPGQMAEAIGAMMVAYVTEVHLNAGLIHDSVVEETIESEQADNLVKLSSALLEAVYPRLETLSKNTDFSEGDKKAFQETVSICKSIKKELEALSSYIESESDEDLEVFQKARSKAQEKVDKLFKK